MHNELPPAPPPIGGWLILVAYKLILILGFSLKKFLLTLPYLVPASEAMLFQNVLSLVIFGVTGALSAYAALLFFGRRIEFRRFFIAIACLDTLSIVLFFTYSTIDPYTIARFLLPSLSNIACLAYLFFSRLVKNTFVFDRNTPDPAILFTKGSGDDMQREPPQIHGLLIVAGAGLIILAHTSWSELIHNLLFESQDGALLETLLFIAHAGGKLRLPSAFFPAQNTVPVGFYRPGWHVHPL